jgi:hypothetical protein
LQNLPHLIENKPVFGPFSPGTVLALHHGMEAAKKVANSGIVSVAAHPFVPYILVLLALLRNL